MKNTFAEKWINLGSLGEGGQGHVFRVAETRDQASPQFALKRLKRENRSDRFFQEIAALKAINHPNVIPIIDHSKIEASEKDEFPYFFVMPIAENGNLLKRVGLYKDNLDSVIEVSTKLASAIRAAHAAGYIHRDVKPGNVLFKEPDHNPWLSDFGICHNIESERLTRVGDVMGPRGFTAPELENGDCEKIDPSCDIYSLGKVIYYMISGGTILGREQFDSNFQNLGLKGERYRLLQTLLSKMICTLSTRVRSIDTVIADLTRVKDWEQSARTLALNSDALAIIDKSQKASIDASRIRAENKRIQDNTNFKIQSAAKGLCVWLEAELEKLKSLMSQSGTYDITIQDVTWNESQNFFAGNYVSVSGKEFVFVDRERIMPTLNFLKFFVCKKAKPQIVMGNNVRPILESEPEMSLVPFFQEGDNHNKQFGFGLCGFIKNKSVVERSNLEFSRRTNRRYTGFSEPLIAKTFSGPPINLLVEFRASEWPAFLEQIKAVFSEAVKVVVEHSMSDMRSTGP